MYLIPNLLFKPNRQSTNAGLAIWHGERRSRKSTKCANEPGCWSTNTVFGHMMLCFTLSLFSIQWRMVSHEFSTINDIYSWFANSFGQSSSHSGNWSCFHSLSLTFEKTEIDDKTSFMSIFSIDTVKVGWSRLFPGSCYQLLTSLCRTLPRALALPSKMTSPMSSFKTWNIVYERLFM